MTDDKIQIHLRNCTVPLFVGVYDHEKPQAQPVIIDIEVIAPLTQHYDDLKSAAVSSVMNYEKLYDFVMEVLPSLGHIPLLESLAERIIRFCFEDPRVSEVRVRLDKPNAFKNKADVGIEMHRTRKSA